MEFLIVFVLSVLCQSFAINGIYHLCSKGELFYVIFGLEKYADNKSMWLKPLYKCVKCQSSFWGTVGFWFIMLNNYDFEWYFIGFWILNCLMLIPINYLIYKKV